MMARADLLEQLRDPARAGIRPLPANTLEVIRSAADEAGHAFILVDLAGCRDKATLLAALSTALKFPPWFGHNWDALADCLGDLAWLPAAGYVIVLQHLQALQRDAPDVLQTALEIFGDTIADWQRRAVPMSLFVDTEGSPPDHVSIP